ncbi:MAG: peroxiredoxin [Cyanothece sp. SIO2G6]|nr:peroxiredoxin [Cyanothece sp. SIO2G6]
MLNIGDRAPDFTLADQNGNTVTLDSLLAQGDLILYFYPADFTPVCTAEACAFRDAYDEITDVGVQIVGINAQDQAMHQKFATTYSLPFPLLCDPQKTVIRAYGVDGMLGFGVRRATFRIDQNKQIRNCVVADLMVESHMELIRAVLEEKQLAGDTSSI